MPKHVIVTGSSAAGMGYLTRALARAGLKSGGELPFAGEDAPAVIRTFPFGAALGEALGRLDVALAVFALEDGAGAHLSHEIHAALDALAAAGVPVAVFGHPRMLENADAVSAQLAPPLRKAFRLKAADLRAALAAEAAAGAPEISLRRPFFFSIKESSPSLAFRQGCGDYYFAESLARAFRRLGHEAEAVAKPDWERPARLNQIDINLRGQGRMPARPGVPLLLWLIYPSAPPVMREEVDEAAHVFCSSAIDTDRIAGTGVRNLSHLPQAFDPEIMYPAPASAARSGLLFVANNHFHQAKSLRPIARIAREAGSGLEIWGKYWGPTPLYGQVRGEVLANERLGAAYRGAEAVLCDHLDGMRRAGYVSNRMFDALACGAPVISDPIPGAPEEFFRDVYVAKDAATFRAAVREIRAETAEDRRRRHDLARSMRAAHTFDHRVRTILETLERLGVTP